MNTQNAETSICTHDRWESAHAIYSGHTGIGVHYDQNYIWWRNPYFAGWTVDDLKAWLDSESEAGRPVYIIGERVTPLDTPLDYEAVKTYYDYTQIYTIGSEINPIIEGKFRVMEG